MISAVEQYKEALVDRRRGNPSILGPDSSFPEVKPDFYADAHLMSLQALRVYNGFRQIHPPYGLVDAQGNTISNVRNTPEPWVTLYRGLRTTARAAIEQTEPPVTSCPYHEVVLQTLGKSPLGLLQPRGDNERGLETLRNAVVPGAVLNTALFVSLVRRLPALQRLHGDNSDAESFARASVVLLDEPMTHPQARAQPFVFSLGDYSTLLTHSYLADARARAYTKVETRPDNQRRLIWAIPTGDFTLLESQTVEDRVAQPLTNGSQANKVTYPIGTPLRDIAYAEAAIGCPGKEFAYGVWGRAIDVAAGEGLWRSDGYAR